MSDVIAFAEAIERRVAANDQVRRTAPAKIETSGYHKYVLELEHEMFDVKEQFFMVHRDLMLAKREIRKLRAKLDEKNSTLRC